MGRKLFDAQTPYRPRPRRTGSAVRRLLALTGLLAPAPARPSNRHDPRRAPEGVHVWDAKLGAFRNVDSTAGHDPLAEAARLIAAVEAAGCPCATRQAKAGTPVAAAPQENTDSDQRTTPPRSPFGGGNGVALECGEE